MFKVRNPVLRWFSSLGVIAAASGVLFGICYPLGAFVRYFTFAVIYPDHSQESLLNLYHSGSALGIAWRGYPDNDHLVITPYFDFPRAFLWGLFFLLILSLGTMFFGLIVAGINELGRAIFGTEE